jgi:parallel beta-helix repeat protein
MEDVKIKPRGQNSLTKTNFTFLLLLLLMNPGILLMRGFKNETDSLLTSSRHLSLTPNSANLISQSPLQPTSYQIHPPISISGNGEFQQHAMAGDWPGEGTPSAPYVIEGFNITGSKNTELISIRDTNIPFIISRCWLLGGYYGIRLINTSNGQISSNILTNNRGGGIILGFSRNNTITENFVANKIVRGISLFTSHNNSILWNDFIGIDTHSFSQAYDDSVNNTFAYNHWNQWIEPDMDADGIVDLPYRVAGTANNHDAFPRTFPFQKNGTLPIEHIITNLVLVLLILVALMISFYHQRRK